MGKFFDAYHRQASRWQGKAVVEKTIQPLSRGRVHFQGTSWYAECQQELQFVPGEVVEVIGIHQKTLMIEPVR